MIFSRKKLVWKSNCKKGSPKAQKQKNRIYDLEGQVKKAASDLVQLKNRYEAEIKQNEQMIFALRNNGERAIKEGTAAQERPSGLPKQAHSLKSQLEDHRKPDHRHDLCQDQSRKGA